MASLCRPCPPAKPETSLHPSTRPTCHCCPSRPGSGPSVFVASLSPFQHMPELERVPLIGKAKRVSPIWGWYNHGRGWAEPKLQTLTQKTCLKEPAQVSLLPAPAHSPVPPPLPPQRAAGQLLSCGTVNLFCSLALHSLPEQAQVGSTLGPPISSSTPLLPFLGISAIKAVGVAPSPELGSPGPAAQRGAHCKGPRPPASKEEHPAGCRARCSRPKASPCAFHPISL